MRRCEIDKIGVDLPCLKKAVCHIKITSKHIGIHAKVKIYICRMHFDQLSDRGQIDDLIKDSLVPDWEPSGKYSATLSD